MFYSGIFFSSHSKNALPVLFSLSVLEQTAQMSMVSRPTRLLAPSPLMQNWQFPFPLAARHVVFSHKQHLTFTGITGVTHRQQVTLGGVLFTLVRSMVATGSPLPPRPKRWSVAPRRLLVDWLHSSFSCHPPCRLSARSDPHTRKDSLEFHRLSPLTCPTRYIIISVSL